ncbi:MAG: TonB-dependent receptor [Colwellia sp.]
MSSIIKFKTNLLAFSIMIALSTSALSANAADKKNIKEKESEVEVITVTGIYSSQKAALFSKRYADSIMDSIAAEDLGKFPDQNISESLQRIPGITISRAGGEGQQITVRGLGPEHNTVLLNGRVLATENEGREFNFDVLASELMTGVDVYKAPTASLQEGGIGSTVNMKTARPLNYKGFQAVASVKAYHDDNSGSTTPQYSGLISNTFMDGQFGLLASFNYSKKKFLSESAFTDGYEHLQSSDFSGLSAERQTELSVYDGDGYGEGISMATWYQESIDNAVRERTGGTLAAQWQVNNELLITVDGIYSKLDVNSNAFGPAKWFGASMTSDVTVNENGTVVGWEGDDLWGGIEQWSFSRPRYAETKQFGFNADWQASDQLTLTFDASHSTASNSPVGRNIVISTVTPDGSNIVTQAQGDALPTYTLTSDTGNTSTLKHNWVANEGANFDDTSTQITLDALYEIDDSMISSVLAGVSYNSREKEKNTSKSNPQCGAVCDDNDGFYPSNVFSSYDASDFLGGNSAYPYWLKPDFDAINDILKANNDSYTPEYKPRESGIVKENTTSAYLQANLEGELGDMPWSGNIGFRYSQTDVESIGENQELLSITIDPTDPNEPIGNFSEPTDITDKGDYSVFLPSVNFKLDVQEDISVRVAAGKTITRPTLSLLALQRDWNLRPNDRTLNIGNPSLKPLIAWNYDLSLSWYIDDVSYISAAVFYKSLKDDFQQSVDTEVFFDEEYTVYSVENKGEGDVSGIEIAAQYTFSQLPEPFNGLGVSANYTDVTRKQDDDSFEDESQSYNASIFYEKGPVQARLAYNFRDGYLASLNGNRGQPKMIDDFGQLDASASYDINDNLTLFAEANNITNEKTFSYSIYKERMIELKDTGSRYALGLRYKF